MISAEARNLPATLRRAAALVESILAESTGASPADNYRRRPGGSLNEKGEAEIERRFDAGFSDSEIALGMNISLNGVAKRRGMWRKRVASENRSQERAMVGDVRKLHDEEDRLEGTKTTASNR
jgi:hypothetical protein